MKVTDSTRMALKVRRENLEMGALGYIKTEIDWRLHRGDLMRSHRVSDVRIAADGKHVFYKLSEKPCS